MRDIRFEGVIKSWNDERGFGFIEPNQGGQEIFVHVKAFRGLRERPLAAQRVTFQVEIGPQGKKRAVNVEQARLPVVRARNGVRSRSKKQGAAEWGGASLFAVPAFVVVLFFGYTFGQPPRWMLWLYPLISVVTFLAYAADKSAARQGAWRTSEQTLHVLALVGGWPGAIVAQQLLRHKSSKAEFRLVFWGTVLMNIVAFVFLASPYGQLLASA